MDDSAPPFTRVVEPSSDHLSYSGIRFSAEAVWQADDQRRIIERIEKKEVLRSELHRGSPEQWPAVSFVLGLLLASAGYYLWLLLLGFLQHSGRFNPRMDVLMLLLFGLGLWLLHKAAIAKRYFLWIVTRKGRRKLVFNARAHLPSIRDMLDKASQLYDWKVDEKIG